MRFYVFEHFPDNKDEALFMIDAPEITTASFWGRDIPLSPCNILERDLKVGAVYWED